MNDGEGTHRLMKMIEEKMAGARKEGLGRPAQRLRLRQVKGLIGEQPRGCVRFPATQ
jgi:hypothetical protein